MELFPNVLYFRFGKRLKIYSEVNQHSGVDTADFSDSHVLQGNND